MNFEVYRNIEIIGLTEPIDDLIEYLNYLYILHNGDIKKFEADNPIRVYLFDKVGSSRFDTPKLEYIYYDERSGITEDDLKRLKTYELKNKADDNEYTYSFLTGDISKVYATNDIFTVLKLEDLNEQSRQRKIRRYETSDGIFEETTKEPSDELTDNPILLFEEKLERMREYKLLREALKLLTKTQYRRLMKYAYGMSIRDIAIEEQTHHRAIEDSINRSRNLIINHFKNNG